MTDQPMRASKRIARLRVRQQAEVQATSETAQHAVGYVRVSTDEQAANGFGLETQERAIRAFAESQGYELIDVVADPGVSGATRPSEREGFARMLAESKGRCSVLLVWKFDRLARNIVYAVTAANELSTLYGIQIRSVTEPIDTATVMGRTIFAVLAGMAEQERQAITERTWSGRRQKATHGGYAGGAVPYGYRKDLNGGLAIDEAEATVVRRMFELAQGGTAHASIARTLNGLGLKTRRGLPWRHGAIGYILDNPKYKGHIEYLFRWAGGDDLVLREGAHAAIVAVDSRM